MSKEFTGGPVSYYKVEVKNPASIKKPYKVECLDVIESLGMSFNEGELFKALWRRCAARTLNVKKKTHDDTYDIEKILFYAKRVNKGV